MKEKELERTLKALANRRRLAVIRYLKANCETSVGEVASAIKLSFRATSKHLGILAAANIVDKEQKGLTVYYRLARPLPPPAKAVSHLV